MEATGPDVREVRLAVVMTGGVSLAVWIGGVVAEIYRAVCGAGIYGALCEETSSVVAVDVITGASAGGVNGAFLSAALAYRCDAAMFDGLRDVWLNDGGFDRLLRDPHEKDPPSLLQGDAYFLRQLGQELDEWVPKDHRRSDGADPPELHLAMTATTLSSDPHVFRDDLGTRIVEPVHRARFTFTEDDFANPHGLADKLALAARATASFPGAFEPALVPVNTSLRRGEITLPDMAGIASFDSTRWVIDGGVLVNQPVGPALEAIKRRSADGEVRRVLLYVNPDPGDVAATDDQLAHDPDPHDEMPSLVSVVSKALVSLPRTESVAADLATITLHNHRLRRQRDTRSDLLLGFRVSRPPDGQDDVPWPDVQVDLVGLARQLFPIWLRRRALESVERRLQAQPGGYDPLAPVVGTTYTWGDLEDELRAARARIGWLSSQFPDFGDLRDADGTRSPTPGRPPSAQWRYGLDPLEYVVSVVLNIIGRTYSLLPITARDSRRADAALEATLPDEREQLGRLRKLVHQQRALLQELRAVDADYWCAELGRPPLEGETVAERAGRLHAGWPLPSVPLAAAMTNAPGWRRSRTWARAAALFAQAEAHRAELTSSSELTGWDVAAELVLATAPAADLDALQQRVAGGDAGERPDLAASYRNAELLIGRRLAELLSEVAPLCYRACDRHLHDWRARVVDVWTTTGAEADWNQPVVPGVGGDGVDAAGPLAARAAMLAAEVIRLTWSPVQDDPAVPPQARTWDALLEELFALYIVHTMSDRGLDDREVRIAFVQVSADAPSPLSPEGGAAAKVAGLQLGHFGGFLKRSWRANDWMWGALDGAAHLVAVLLDGERLHQRYLTWHDAAEGLAAIARGRHPSGGYYAELTDDDTKFLDEIVDQGAMAAELEAHWNSLSATNLQYTVRTLVTTAQLLIARRELVSVGQAVRQSAKEHAAESDEATAFLGRLWRFLPPSTDDLRRREERHTLRATVPPPMQPIPTIPLREVEALIATSPVGGEKVAGEYGSDRLTSTAAQAAAVAGNVVASHRFGVGFLRGPVRVAKWGLRGLYYLAASAVKDTKTSAAFRNLLLAVSGVIIALLVFGIDVPAALLVGALVAVAGWLTLTVRSVRGWWALVGLAPLLLAILLVAVLVLEPDTLDEIFSDAGDERWLGPALWVGLVAAALGVIVEAVRALIGAKTHFLHALVWAAAGLVWWGAWLGLFHGPYTGPRQRVLEVLADVHRVRIGLLVAIPAALVGYELVRTWWVRKERERRRRAAAGG